MIHRNVRTTHLKKQQHITEERSDYQRCWVNFKCRIDLKIYNLKLIFLLQPISFFLDAFAKSRKWTITFVMSVRPYGTTWLSLEGFLRNFILEYLLISVEKFQVPSKTDRNIVYFAWDQYKSLIKSRSTPLRMRTVSDKICREYQNTHFMFNNLFFFRKILPLWDVVEKYCTARQATDENIIRLTLFASRIKKAADNQNM